MSGLGAFQASLAHVGELHRQELDLLRQEYEAQLHSLSRENHVLRARIAALKRFEALPSDGSMGCGSASLATTAVGCNSEAVISPEDVHFDNGTALLPLLRRTSTGRGVLADEPVVTAAGSGDFTVKECWNRYIESQHWGANLDAWMFSSNLKAQQEPRRRSGRASIAKRSLVAHAAASVEGSEVTSEDIALTAFHHPELEDIDRGCSIYPNSTFRLTWDLAGLLLISYDLVTIPFTLAFEPPDSWFSMGMDWLTLLFWTGDMLQGFFLGYFEKGQYVNSNHKILRHYMMTWFLPDAVVVMPEWLMTIVASSARASEGKASDMFKFLKGARAFRVLRLLRLLKLQRIINLLYDLIESEHTFICVNLARLLLAVLVLNHVIACIWYGIGRICRAWSMRNWIDVGEVEDTTIGYKYSTSMHWSLTQFTPASMDISARNVFERVFSIVVLFFAVVAFSSIVASITGSMTSLRNMKTEEMKQFWLLRRYLRQREVTTDLSDRIFKYLEHQTAKQSKLVQTNSLKATLPKLSLALQSELTHQLNSRHLVRHPFFSHLDAEMGVVMHRLCHTCLVQLSHAEKEVVFSAGDKAAKMYFIKTGLLDYTMVDGSRLDPPPRPEDWVGEPVLWTEWRHTGRLQSVTANDLIAVEPAQFVEVMCVHPRSWFYAKRYAVRFIDYLNTLESWDAMDIIRDAAFYEGAVEGCDTSEDAPRETFYKEDREMSVKAKVSFVDVELPMTEGVSMKGLRRLRSRDQAVRETLSPPLTPGAGAPQGAAAQLRPRLAELCSWACEPLAQRWSTW